MLKVMDILDENIHTGNPIFMIDTSTGLPVAGNKEANNLFAESKNVFDFFKIFNKEVTIQLFFILENFTGEKVLDDCYLTTLNRDLLNCSIEFTYAKDTKEAILLVVKIKEDHRPHYLKVLINHIKRPTFLLECKESEQICLYIHDANELFYKAFNCSADTIGQRYEHLLQNMITSEGEDNYISEILESTGKQDSGIVKIPLQNVQGEDLAVYFSHSAIKRLIDQGDKRIFCQLVKADMSLEAIECPFTR